MRKDWVIDIETLINCFCLVAIDCRTDEEKTFVIHEKRNDLAGLLDFLDDSIKWSGWHIGFNTISFDAQVIQYIINSRVMMKDLPAEEIVKLIYEKAQEMISKTSMEEFSFYDEKGLQIRQLDLFRVLGYQNPTKRTSLKWIEYAMDFDSIVEMPIKHSQSIHTLEEVKIVTDYCRNDVLATKMLMKLCKSEIGLRRDITEKYRIKCYNYSDTKIGSELLLDLYCKKTGKNKWEVKKISTKRDRVALKDIIFPYIKFESPEFKVLLDKVKEAVVNPQAKGDFKFSQTFKGSTFDYGKGGIHQCIHPGVFHSDDTWIIKDLDVAGMYPSIAVENGMYPAHLGKEFYEIYKNDIVDVRMKEKVKKEGKNMAIVEGFKQAGNSTYGNSNNKFSWLYDPQYTYETAVNGQLMLTMLVEKLILALPDSVLLQTNTDGATLMIKKENVTRYHELCKEWEKLTRLVLEFSDYKSMYIRDVNNYIAVYMDGKTKCKGFFEWEPMAKYKTSHLHKNKSFLVIPKAVYAFFMENMSPEKYLDSNKNIMDYCGGAKTKGEWEFKEIGIVNGEVVTRPLQRVTRYYVSKKGFKMIKHNKADGREIQVEAGKWLQTAYNKHDPNKKFEDFDINREFYLGQIYKEIANVSSTGAQEQLTIF